MPMGVYRYSFCPHVPAERIEAALVVSLLALEALYGESRARLEAAHYFDQDLRVLIIDATSKVGADLCRLFTGFLAREAGPNGFQIQRIRDEFRQSQKPCTSNSRFNGLSDQASH